MYIEDVVEAWLRALAPPATPGTAYNIGSRRPTTVRALLAALDLPPQNPIRELAGSASDQFGLCADVTRAQTDLGWQAHTRLADGLRTMAARARSAGAER